MEVNINKERIIGKAAQFPHVFKILPIIDGRPSDDGTWAAYPNDEVTTIWVNTSHPEAQKFYQEQIRFEEEKEMSKALTVQEDKTIKGLIASNLKAIQSVLPKHLTPERFTRIAYMSITSNPTLARCSQMSLINTIIESSQLGLEIGGATHEAELVPFKNNRTGTYEATLVVEYGGYIKLAMNHPIVRNITARPVFENDDFHYCYGLNQDIKHQPASGDRGKLTNAYCIVWYVNGGVDFEVIGQAEADAAKNKSAAKFKKDSPWNQEDNLPAMWVKTSIRRIMKRVPKSSEQRFMQVDGMSGMDMDYVSNDSNILDLSGDDFHTVSLNESAPNPEQKPAPKSAPKSTSKKQSPANDKAKTTEKNKEEPSKARKQLNPLAGNFPDEYKTACANLGFVFDDGSVPIPDQLQENDIEPVIKELNSVLDTENQA